MLRNEFYSPDARIKGNYTALHEASTPAVVKVLMVAGADPYVSSDVIHLTPLHPAAIKKQLDMAKALLDGGVNPNMMGEWLLSPLETSVILEALGNGRPIKAG